MAQLAFEAAKVGAKALLCGPKSGLSGQQLPAGGWTARVGKVEMVRVWNVPQNDGSEDVFLFGFLWPVIMFYKQNYYSNHKSDGHVFPVT